MERSHCKQNQLICGSVLIVRTIRIYRYVYLDIYIYISIVWCSRLGTKAYQAHRWVAVPSFQSMQQGDSEARASGDTMEGSHANGTCNPCVFWASAGGCTKDDCEFCHLEHFPADTGRPRKVKREAIKERLTEIFLIPEEDERHQLLQEEAARHPFARSLIHGSNHVSCICWPTCLFFVIRMHKLQLHQYRLSDWIN